MMAKMNKKVVLFLLTILSCFMLIGGETSYTPAEKKFVCNLYETYTNIMKEMSRGHLSRQEKMDILKKMLLAGDIAVVSRDCPKDFRQNWNFFSTNCFPAMKLVLEAMVNKRELTKKEQEYVRKVDKASKELERIYKECK